MTDQASLDDIDTTPNLRDAGPVPDVPSARRHPASGMVIGM